MNLCGGCKHFSDEELEGWDPEKEDMVKTGYHRCNLIDLKRSEQKVPPPLAYAQDASDYRACLIVRAEFGCVEWAAKDSAERTGAPHE